MTKEQVGISRVSFLTLIKSEVPYRTDILNRQREMNLLELFSGSESISGVAKDYGFNTLSVDKLIKSDLQMDIQDVTKDLILERLGIPDVIWASPVCSAWSKTGWFHYWNTEIYSSTKKFVPSRPYALESVGMVSKTIEIFSWFPDATFFMENPEGMLSRHPVINDFIKRGLDVRRYTVTYCQYGDTVRKPTHIWTNSKTWKPKRQCSLGDPCHISSPRGKMKGSRSKVNAFERSKIPVELCKSVIHSTQKILA